MNIDISGFHDLFETLRGIDLAGQGPPPVPDDLRAATAGSLTMLPKVYRDDYGQPLLDNFDVLAAQLDATTLETLAGAVYDHGQEAVLPQLHQFLAVISNLYRSFLSSQKRAAAGIKLSEQFPPVAMFQHTGDNGPFTLPADATQQMFGSSIGVVSLPSVYRDHPLLWASLAHETGGHDVLHADADLLAELSNGVQTIFGGGSVGGANSMSAGKFLGTLWSYWIDEAASDVYGVLNIGPTFGLNLAVFFAALNAAFTGSDIAALRTASGADNTGNLDPHPTDILRIDLIRGVVDSLVGLSQDSRAAYDAALDSLSASLGGTAQFVTLQGLIRADNAAGVRVHTKAPMAQMKTAARTVGSYIATTKLSALDGHSIQDLETWDNPDESAAQAVNGALKAGQSAANLGDDAQLLAGATLAAFVAPEQYQNITAGLAAALTASWDADPIWSAPKPDPTWLSSALLSDAEFGPHVTVAWS